MRALLLILIGSLTLGLGVATSLVQCQNHELAARLDARQRKWELTRMFISSAEAEVLASEILLVAPEDLQAQIIEGVQ